MSKKKGDLGEDIAVKILNSQGFLIIERNFYTRYGEIDIIAQKGNKIHFIEVKSSLGEYDPAFNFHQTKLKRLIKSIKIYCYRYNISDTIIQVDLMLINMQKRVCKIINNANLYFH